MKSELDIFVSPPINRNLLKTEEVSYKPIASLDNYSVLEFVSHGHGNTYRDLSSIYFRLKVQLIKLKNSKEKHFTDEEKIKIADGSDVTIDPIGGANNLMHSQFRQCTAQLNSENITQRNNNYHYRALIENLLNYGKAAASAHLESVGWYLDQNEMEVIEDVRPGGGPT